MLQLCDLHGARHQQTKCMNFLSAIHFTIFLASAVHIFENFFPYKKFFSNESIKLMQKLL